MAPGKHWAWYAYMVPLALPRILDLWGIMLQTYLDQPQRLRSSSTLDRRPSFALCWFPGWPSGGVNGRPFFQAGKPFIRLGSHLSGWEAICKAGKPLVRLGSHPGWEAVCQAGKPFVRLGSLFIRQGSLRTQHVHRPWLIPEVWVDFALGWSIFHREDQTPSLQQIQVFQVSNL